MKFGRPEFLLLLAFLPVLLWMARRSRSGLERGRAVAATALRVLLWTAAVFALADAQHVSRSDRTATIFLLDHSFSVPYEVKRDATAWINARLEQVPPEDVAGVILFGREAMIETPAREKPPPAGLTSVVGRTATDLGAAIRLALAVFPEGYQRRIVVVSDGNENLGDARAEAERARAHGAVIDVFPLRYDYPGEVWVEGVHVPPDVTPKEPFDVTVVVNAQRAGPANLILFRDKALLSVQKVRLNQGKNVYTVRQQTEGGGSLAYRAVVEMEGDVVAENNEAHGLVTARGPARVAVVAGEAADAEHLTAALAAEGIPSVALAPDGLAGQAAELAAFDAVLFVNVEAAQVGRGAMQAVASAVHDAGVGFAFVGGERSYGPGGYRGSPIEELLPVSMEQPQRRVMPNGALALILHTCEFDNGNFWAKRIAIAALETLNPRDFMGVLQYGGSGEEWLFPMSPASDKERMAGLISGAYPGDMPSFDLTMQMAHAGLKSVEAAAKHVVIVSDADPSGPSVSLVDAMVADRISITTIAIQPHGSSDLQKMALIARRAKGRFYEVTDPRTLPQIFIKEASTIQRSMVIEGRAKPVVVGASEALKGIDPGSVPPIHGYTLTNAKPLARVSLGVPVAKENPGDSGGADVLLAEWQYGLGKTMAFTSDAKNRWGKEWVAWSDYRKFWSQAVRSILRSTGRGPHAVQAEIENGKGRIVVDAVGDDGRALHTLRMAGSVTTPEGRKADLAFRQTGPGRYEAEFEAAETGVYSFAGAFEGAHGEKGYLSQGIPLSYAPEYRDLQANESLLDQLRVMTGGRRLGTASDVFAPVAWSSGVARPLWPLLLAILLAVWPVDIFLRRVAVDWGALLARMKGRLRRPAPAPDAAAMPEHLKALAARKLEVRETRAAEEIDLAAMSRPSAPPPPEAPSGAPPSSEPAKPAGEPGYLDKLLEAKKRAKKE